MKTWYEVVERLFDHEGNGADSETLYETKNRLSAVRKWSKLSGAGKNDLIRLYQVTENGLRRDYERLDLLHTWTVCELCEKSEGEHLVPPRSYLCHSCWKDPYARMAAALGGLK